MPSPLTNVGKSLLREIQRLSGERDKLDNQIDKLKAAAAALSGVGDGTPRRRGRPPGSKNKRGPGRPPKRQLSTAARKAISDAQKVRWAKFKKKAGTTKRTRTKKESTQEAPTATN